MNRKLTHEEQVQRDLEEVRNAENFRVVALGEEARKFLTSDLAQFITDSAELRAHTAQQKLAVADPTNVAEIVRLQEEIKLYSHFNRCLSEIVAAGDTAYQMYLLEHQND
jgi:DUF971 family protein